MFTKSIELIKYLYYAQPATCADLSACLHKSIPHTNKLLNEILEGGFAQENGLADSSGGRRPLTYSLVPDKLYVVSVAIDQHLTRIAIFNLQNEHIGEIIEIPLLLTEDKKALEKIAKAVKVKILSSNLNEGKIIGLGLSMPGFIDIDKGVNYTFFGEDTDIKKYMEKQLNLPVFIDNDSSLIALAELKFGIKDQRDVMVVNIGWGIGLGMILNGEMFRGHSGFAGEFSHIPLYKDGELCSCGKRDCLETQASLTYIEAQAKKEMAAGHIITSIPKNSEITIETIFHYAANGDEFCIKLISQAAYNIGRGLAILIHIINPELIILSGWGSSLGKVWLAPVQQAINEHSIPRLAEKTQLHLSKLGNYAALIGGAALVIEHLEEAMTANEAFKAVTT